MDPLLLAITIVSLMAALGFGVVSWRLMRDRRERSDARVAALTAAIDSAQHADTAVHAVRAGTEVPAYGGGEARPVETLNPLFAPERSAVGHGSPLIKAAVGVVMAVALTIAIAMANRGPSDAPSAGAGGARVSARESGAPLELVSMRHVREHDRLTVSGLVRNPRAGASVARVTAVVFAFDRAGAFVASGRAPLDFTTLEPGDESPFVVTVAGASDVGRYRVTFRTEAGVMRHIDRRTGPAQLAAARLQE